MVIAVGGRELAEFRRQAQAFAAAWSAAEHPCESLLLDGRNHFDTGEDLGDPASEVSRTILRQMGLGRL
jgi:hypothetical protein